MKTKQSLLFCIKIDFDFESIHRFNNVKNMQEIHYRIGEMELLKREHKNRSFLYIGTFFIIIAGLSIGILILMLFLGRLDGTY